MMKILIFPYFEFIDLEDIQKIINENSIKCNVQNLKKMQATFDYSKSNEKFIIHPDCNITIKDIEKSLHKQQSLGNGISRGSVNKKPYTWIVLKGGSDVSKKSIDKIYEILKQENIKGQVA